MSLPAPATSEERGLADMDARPPLRVDILSDFAVAERIHQEWNMLVANRARPNIFLTFEWLSTWWKWFGRGDLRIVTVWRGQELQAIAPFYVARRRLLRALPLKQLRLVGDGGSTYPEYLGPIVRADGSGLVHEALATASLHLRKECHSVRFVDMAIDDLDCGRIVEALADGLARREQAGVRCPYLAVPASYEAFLAGLSSHGRARERRLLRKAHQAHRVELEKVNDPGQFEALFPEVLRLHRSARARHGQRSPFTNPDYAGFHREVMARCLGQGWLRLYVLRFDGKPVAFQYGYLYQGCYSDFQSGFDAAYESSNPGDVLLQLVIGAVIEEGAEEFDFLRGAHGYKKKFATKERETRTVTLAPPGGIVHLAMAVKDGLIRPVGRALRRRTTD